MNKSQNKTIHAIVLNNTRRRAVPSQAHFQKWVDAVTLMIPKKIPRNAIEVCIAIVDHKTSAQLNEQYRQKKGPTNVLSFTYDDIPTDSLGDLAICAALVAAEAKAQQQSLESHWAHLTIHGILHLLGFDHIDENDAEIMESTEIKILQQLGFENPYV